MELKAYTCPRCGAALEADEFTTTVRCPHCDVTLQIQQDKFFSSFNDEYLMKAELLIRENKDFKNAKSKYESITTSNPRDPRPWLGLVRCLTCDFTEKLYIEPEGETPIWLEGAEENLLFYFSKYEQLEKKEQTLASIKSHFDTYLNTNKKEYEELLEKYPKTDVDQAVTYETTIQTANKIISNENLKLIFEELNKTAIKLRKISEAETKRNMKYDSNDEEASFDRGEVTYTFTVDFTDSTESKLDNYDEFMNIFETRLKEIKSIDVYYYISYDIRRPKTPTKPRFYDCTSQRISLNIKQDKFEITTSMKSDDRKLDKVYQIIKKIVNEAPVKYDNIVKKRGTLQMFIGFSLCLLPATLISLLLLINDSFRETIFNYAYIFPVICFGLSFALSSLVFMRLSSMYKSIIPEQKYAGYKDHKSVYVDDVEDFTKKSEVIIGKNYRNLEIRETIKKLKDLCKKLILPELLGVGVISVIVYIISMNA